MYQALFFDIAPPLNIDIRYFIFSIISKFDIVNTFFFTKGLKEYIISYGKSTYTKDNTKCRTEI